MNPQKEFKIASIILLILGAFDLFLVSTEWFGSDSIIFENNIYLIIIFSIITLIPIAKIYMGIMGIKYSKGTGKGRLHIILAKIGVVFSIIAIVISVLDLIFGSGTLETLIGDALDTFVICWYHRLAKKNYQ